MSTANFSSAAGIPPFSLPPVGQERLLTAADLAALPDRLPSGQVKYELHRGRLVIMSLPGRRHGAIQARLASAFVVQGQENGLGETFTETGVIVARNPDSVSGPDVAFVGKAKFPVIETSEGYLETIPDIVVEIRSKNDTRNEIDEKTQEYLAAGIPCVWVIDPTARTVTIYRAGEPPTTYRDDETLPAPEAIPGFSLPVKKVFETTGA